MMRAEVFFYNFLEIRKSCGVSWLDWIDENIPDQVTFDVDSNGILSVCAVDKATRQANHPMARNRCDWFAQHSDAKRPGKTSHHLRIFYTGSCCLDARTN